MEGLHSPWGSIWSIAAATGWTWNEIMWRVAWHNIEMMITDAPRYIAADTPRRGKPIENEGDLVSFIL